MAERCIYIFFLLIKRYYLYLDIILQVKTSHTMLAVYRIILGIHG